MMDDPATTTGLGRVLLIADRHLVGEAVLMALRSRSITTASFPLPSTRSEHRGLLRWVARYRPQVGVLLCEMTESVFVCRAAVLVELVPIPWLLLTSSRDPRRWGGLMAAGVGGVLPMTASLDDLCATLLRLEAGQPLMSASSRDKAVDTWREHDRQLRELREHLSRLTPREQAVLEKLALGRSVRDIATAHAVSEGTVRSQVKAILRKLDVSSQLAAVALYRAAGDLKLDGSAPRRSSTSDAS